jgi:catechol 2,3-dioxygenase-like lactoylglutathione lyase family enzyme
MKQLLHFITLGVHDLEKMKDWYKQKFGWETLKDEHGIIFFKLNGFILGLFPADELAEDMGISQDGKGFKRFSLAIRCGCPFRLRQHPQDGRRWAGGA